MAALAGVWMRQACAEPHATAPVLRGTQELGKALSGQLSGAQASFESAAGAARAGAQQAAAGGAASKQQLAARCDEGLRAISATTQVRAGGPAAVSLSSRPTRRMSSALPVRNRTRGASRAAFALRSQRLCEALDAEQGAARGQAAAAQEQVAAGAKQAAAAREAAALAVQEHQQEAAVFAGAMARQAEDAGTTLQGALSAGASALLLLADTAVRTSRC